MPRKTKSQKKEEVIELFEEVEFLLGRIIEDNGVPRNIRKIAQESTEFLSKLDDKDNSPAVCASQCVTSLEDVAQDLNCPLHTRTLIYQILSILEQVRDY